MKAISTIKSTFDRVFEEVNKVIIGQEEVMKEVVSAFFCNAHVLMEGYPGLAKTMLVRTMSDIMKLDFNRIQGTPDLMPSDITGTYIIEESHGKRRFNFQQGPVFSNMVLFDEINRATPKTQSALLEAMQERQVTVGNNTFKLPQPFFVLATQNPIEQEATFPLPEAQTDRFLLKVLVTYPTLEEELKVVDQYSDVERNIKLKQMLTKDSINALQNLTRQVPIANDIKQYAVKLISSTRQKKDLIEYGASPRASIGLILAAKARALLEGRKYVSKQDINTMAFPVLRHRIILSFEAERNNLSEDDVVRQLIK